MRDWSTFNVKFFALPMSALVFGMVIGFGISNSKKKPSKHYPIEVQFYWSTNGYSNRSIMECDSINGDTIYKNGGKIVNKNIINVSFK